MVLRLRQHNIGYTAFGSNTNRTKKVNTDNFYYIKFHIYRFVYRS